MVYKKKHSTDARAARINLCVPTVLKIARTTTNYSLYMAAVAVCCQTLGPKMLKALLILTDLYLFLLI